MRNDLSKQESSRRKNSAPWNHDKGGPWKNGIRSYGRSNSGRAGRNGALNSRPYNRSTSMYSRGSRSPMYSHRSRDGYYGNSSGIRDRGYNSIRDRPPYRGRGVASRNYPMQRSESRHSRKRRVYTRDTGGGGYKRHRRPSYHHRRRNSYASEGGDSSDEQRHFRWRVNQTLCDGRYIVQGLLGEGTFGRVLEATDDRNGNLVAIKVVKDVKRYTNASEAEASILKHLRGLPGHSSSHCLSLYDVFYEGRHICLVTNRLGLSLYEYLKNNKYKGFFMEDIQTVARCVASCLAFLHEKAEGLAHTDLKPENILLMNSLSHEVLIPRPTPGSDAPLDVTSYRPYNMESQVVDFGCAVYRKDYHSSLINTRQYRSPEVILGLPWDERSDVWSLGCILVELYTGNLLFDTHDHAEHLLMMEHVLCGLPQWMLERYYNQRPDRDSGRELPEGIVARVAVRRYITGGRFESCRRSEYSGNRYRNSNKFQITERPSLTQVSEMLESEVLGEFHYYLNDSVVSNEIRRNVALKANTLDSQIRPVHSYFNSFIRHLLNPDPQLRPSASAILRHSFFNTHVVERDFNTVEFIKRNLH